MKRHGDGRPSAARWYQSTIRTAQRGAARRRSRPAITAAGTGRAARSLASAQLSRTYVWLRRGGADQQPAAFELRSGSGRGDDRTQAPAEAVAARGRARPSGRRRSATRNGTARDRRERCTTGSLVLARASGTCQRLERPAVADPPDQAESRVRPLSRRALMIARPARVRMRARKPCLRARRRLLGWNVRFTDSRLSRLLRLSGCSCRPCSTNGQVPRR